MTGTMETSKWRPRENRRERQRRRRQIEKLAALSFLVVFIAALWQSVAMGNPIKQHADNEREGLDKEGKLIGFWQPQSSARA